MKPTSVESPNLGNVSTSSHVSLDRMTLPVPDIEIEQCKSSNVSDNISYSSVNNGISATALASPSTCYDLQTPPHHRVKRPISIPSAPPTPEKMEEDMIVQPRDNILSKDPLDACLDGMLETKLRIREETEIMVQRSQDSPSVIRRSRVRNVIDEDELIKNANTTTNQNNISAKESVRMLDETPRLVPRSNSSIRTPSPMRSSYAATPNGSRNNSRAPSRSNSRVSSRNTSPVRNGPFQVYKSNTQTVQHVGPFRLGNGGGGGGGGSVAIQSSTTPQRSKPILHQKTWNTSSITTELGQSNGYTHRKAREERVDPTSPSQKYGHYTSGPQEERPWEHQVEKQMKTQKPSDISSANPLVSTTQAYTQTHPVPRTPSKPTDLITHQTTQRETRNLTKEARQVRDRNIVVGEEGQTRVREQHAKDPMNILLLEHAKDEINGHSGSILQKKAHTLPAAGAASGVNPNDGLVYGSGTGEDAIKWDPRVQKIREHTSQFREIRPNEQSFVGVDYQQVRAPLPSSCVRRSTTVRKDPVVYNDAKTQQQQMRSSSGVADALRYD